MLEEFIESSARAHEAAEVVANFQRSVAQAGFKNSAFGQYQNGAVTGFLWDDLPGEFSSLYCARGWDRADPLVQTAMHTTGAFVWTTESSDQKLSVPQQEFFGELRARGVRQGVMTPVHGPGGRLDICGTTTDRSASLSSSLIRIVHGVMLQAWLCCADHSTRQLSSPPLLSARELECLKWLRDNKSNWQISQILPISEKTVEFHVGNLMRKLGAEGRLAAVLSGIRLRLIEL